MMYRMFLTIVKVIRTLKQAEKENVYISDYFQRVAKKHPSKIAIMYEDTKITFAELDEASNRVANVLRTSTSLKHGDTVAVFMENCPEFVMVTMALSKLGVRGAYINYNLRRDSLAHCIRVANSSGLIFSSSLSEAVSDVLPNLSIRETLYYMGSECSISSAESLEAAMKTASSSDPPPVEGKSFKGVLYHVMLIAL